MDSTCSYCVPSRALSATGGAPRPSAFDAGLVEDAAHRGLCPAGELAQLTQRATGETLLDDAIAQLQPLLSCLAPGAVRTYELCQHLVHGTARVGRHIELLTCVVRDIEPGRAFNRRRPILGSAHGW